MRLPAFTLHRPHELGEALDLLARHGEDAAVYMGGTELLLLMKLGFAAPGHLVDCKSVAELTALDVGPHVIRVGAGVTHRRLERHADVERAIPAVAFMQRRVANVRVRNVGTLGGNLCFAEPHSDPLTLLTALDASVELASPAGRRRLQLADFCRGAFSTALEPGEIMTAVDIPVPPDGSVVGYQRLAFKERPTVAVAVVHGPRSSRVVVGALGPRPWRVPAAEDALAASDGAAVDAAVAATVDAVAAIDTAEGADYRAHLAGVLLGRACASATPVRRALA